MSPHPLAGQPAPPESLIDVDALLAAFHDLHPDPEDPAQRVAFGTSGHRGTALATSFNEDHVLAVTQAVCEYRAQVGIDGPVFLGKDTHALSRLAEHVALEVLAANGVATVIQEQDGLSPTPVISREILAWNRENPTKPADGIIVTPSHNPPIYGGLKYNPPHGGPAGSDATGWIQERANALLKAGAKQIARTPYDQARNASTTTEKDFVAAYVDDLSGVIDVDTIKASGIRIGVDPLGGSALPYVQALGERLGLDVAIVNDQLDPRFAFLTLDHDGQIRMDCSSSFAMASLIALKDDYDVAFGMDPDADRHGIVAPSTGLLNPNHYLAVAIRYLLRERTGWSPKARVGKTLVSSGIIDRVVHSLGREIYEVPVGFKWFAPRLSDGRLAFAGEESAGGTFLRRNATPWVSDKDGILMGLLAAELTARTGKDPGQHFEEIATKFGRPHYRRVDRPATPAQQERLRTLGPADVAETTLAGEAIKQKLTKAPANGEPIGGLKVVTANGWFAARPSGTEPIYKIYAESFQDEAHLEAILADAASIVERALGA